jgi:GNAT superfamily N-acetyltransferase
MTKTMKSQIDLAQSAAAIAACFPVLVQLRPQLQTDHFVAQVQHLMQQGLQLVSLSVQGQVVSVAGFRIYENLFHGRFMYVDDLITADAARSQGYGKQLFAWLVAHARDNACTSLELDSGVQRFAAHRFYLREGMEIRGHHFSLLFK